MTNATDSSLACKRAAFQKCLIQPFLLLRDAAALAGIILSICYIYLFRYRVTGKIDQDFRHSSDNLRT